MAQCNCVKGLQKVNNQPDWKGNLALAAGIFVTVAIIGLTIWRLLL